MNFLILIGCKDSEIIANKSKPFELSVQTNNIDNIKKIDLDKSISTSITSEATEQDFEFTTREHPQDIKGIDLVIVVDNSYSMHVNAPMYFHNHPMIEVGNSNNFLQVPDSEQSVDIDRLQSFTDKIQLIADQVREKIAQGQQINLTIVSALDQLGFKPIYDGKSSNYYLNKYIHRTIFDYNFSYKLNNNTYNVVGKGNGLLPQAMFYWLFYPIGYDSLIYWDVFRYVINKNYQYINAVKAASVKNANLLNFYDGFFFSFKRNILEEMPCRYLSSMCNFWTNIPDKFRHIINDNDNMQKIDFYRPNFSDYANDLYTKTSNKPCVDTMHKNYSTADDNQWGFSGKKYNMVDVNSIFQNNLQRLKLDFDLVLQSDDLQSYDFVTPYNLDPMFLDAPFYFLDKEFIENILNNSDINTVSCIIEPLSALKVLGSLVDEQKFNSIQSSSSTTYSDIFKDDHQKVFLVISDSFSPTDSDFDRIVIKKTVKTSYRDLEDIEKIDTKKQFQQAANEAFGRSNVRFFSYSPKQHFDHTDDSVNHQYKKPGSGAIRYTGYSADEQNLKRISEEIRSSSFLKLIGFPAFSHAIEHIKYGRYYSSSYRDLSVYFNGDTSGHYSFDDLEFINGVRDNILKFPTSMVDKYLLHDSFSSRDYQILKVTVDDIEISQDKYSIVSDPESNETFIIFVEGVLDHGKVPQKVVVTAKLEAVE